MGRKIVKEKTPEDFDKITRVEIYQLWFIQALTEKKIAKMYGVDRKTVRDKRKQLNIRWLNSAILFLIGGEQYKAPKKQKKAKEKR